jgi:hypothetical protein
VRFNPTLRAWLDNCDVGLSRRSSSPVRTAGASGASGLYQLVDRLATAPARAAAVGALPAEQHVLDGVGVIVDNGVQVLVPPLHHEGADGTLYKEATAIPQRPDFNTLDNPFFWSVQPERDGMSATPAAGLHFVVFTT